MTERVVAVIVAGAGAASEKEVFDLIEDATTDFDTVELVVPISKSLFTEAVQAAVAWYEGDPKEIITVKIDGENGNRASSAVGDGPEEFDSFEDVLRDTWDDFDEVHFYLAMPEPDDEENYDQAVSWIEAAEESDTDFVVKNLCAGLDDIILTDPDAAEADPEPEPEPEPEKPARRARKSRKDSEPEPEPEEEPEADEPDDPQEDPGAPINDFDREAVFKAYQYLGNAVEYFEAQQIVNGYWYPDGAKDVPLVTGAREALEALAGVLRASGTVEGATAPQEPADEPDEAPAEKPSRGRGRPRTNFEEKEIFDEDLDKWVPRPRGRIARGTKWRVVHSDSGETLDEGTV